MLKVTASLAALLFAVPAFAQPANAPAAGQQGPTPPPEFMQAAQAFGQCIGGGVRGLAATVTPEAGATQVLAACTQQKADLESRFEAWVASPSFPAEGRTEAREQFRTHLAQAQTQLAEAIRRHRSGEAPAAAH